MATRSNFVFAIFVLIASIVAVKNIPRISAQCGGAFPKISDACGAFIKKDAKPPVPASTACCDVLKTLDLPCACKFVNSTIEAKVSLDKVAFVVKTCGLKLTPGIKCGSYVVHPLDK